MIISWISNLVNQQISKQRKEYCEITFIHGVSIFGDLVGRLIHEIKNPTNNETW